MRAKAESEVIAGLSRRLTETQAQALDSLSALCLPHFVQLVGTLRNEQLIEELLPRQAALLDRLAEDMKRSALKHDGVRRHLLSAEEETASNRGLALLARARPIAN
jgi:hypothetical protein